MSAIYLFLATYAAVLLLGLQSLNVNGGHKFAAFITSFGIGSTQLFILKIMPGPTTPLDIAAYLLGGPLGIISSMHLHPLFVRYWNTKEKRSKNA